MFFFSRDKVEDHLEIGNQEVSTSGLLFPSFVKLVGRVASNVGNNPLKNINIVRVTAVVASIAVVLGIGISIGLIFLDLISLVLH